MTRSLRVALADDESELRGYCQKLLSRLGHQVVVVAENGRDLLEQCRLQHPDVVLTDLRMPEMGGIPAARVLQQEQPTPIILMSAHFDADALACAEADHVLGCLVKPINPSELEAALERVSPLTIPASPGERGR
jgi:two-component system, response regulator PdtaR